jgi:hypothetical protein
MTEGKGEMDKSTGTYELSSREKRGHICPRERETSTGSKGFRWAEGWIGVRGAPLAPR